MRATSNRFPSRSRRDERVWPVDRPPPRPPRSSVASRRWSVRARPLFTQAAEIPPWSAWRTGGSLGAYSLRSRRTPRTSDGRTDFSSKELNVIGHWPAPARMPDRYDRIVRADELLLRNASSAASWIGGARFRPSTFRKRSLTPAASRMKRRVRCGRRASNACHGRRRREGPVGWPSGAVGSSARYTFSEGASSLVGAKPPPTPPALRGNPPQKTPEPHQSWRWGRFFISPALRVSMRTPPCRRRAPIYDANDLLGRYNRL